MPGGKMKKSTKVWVPPTNGDPLLSPEATAKLLRLYEEALPVMKPSDDEGRQSLYQDLRLEVLHPGEFVVWTDAWKKRGEKRTLVRKILGHAATYEGLLDILEKHNAWGDLSVKYFFIQDPDNPIAMY